MSIRLHVLGAPRCFVNGQELTELPAQKTRFALLTYLAIERNTSRDATAAFFWPASGDERARHALSQALYDLKRVLGDDWLETQGGRLIVTNFCEVDCLEFNTSLQKGERAWALSLYRGAFLDGFFLPNSQQFEAWTDLQRAQLERTHRKARRELMEAMLEAGKFTQAVDAARAWVDVDPLEDEANHRLIELLARSGARAVLPDTTTHSGWRFRTSYHEATLAYRRAFELLPSVHKAYRADNFDPLRSLLKTSRTALRQGSRSGAAPWNFMAYGSIEADTIVFVPEPLVDFYTKPHDVRAVNAAVQYRRHVFRQIASSWHSAYPRSSDALEAVAIALELLGDKSAVDTLSKARQRSTNDDDLVRLADQQVFMRLKYSLPHDLREANRARGLADSLIQTQIPGKTSHPELLAAICVLTGRAEMALRYMRTHRATQTGQVPPALAPAVLPLLVFAAVGGPRDSLSMYDERLAKLIDGALPGEERERARFDWMLRPAYTSLPTYRFQHLESAVDGDPLLAAEAHLARGEFKQVTNIFQPVREHRRDVPPAELTIDVLYPEAWLIFAANRPDLAAEWLDPTLGNMHAWPPFVRVRGVLDVGAWVRAMALRADIAARLHDERGARLWARAVMLLWSDSDRELRPLVRRMQALAH